jgi:hypothetical protein
MVFVKPLPRTYPFFLTQNFSWWKLCNDGPIIIKKSDQILGRNPTKFLFQLSLTSEFRHIKSQKFSRISAWHTSQDIESDMLFQMHPLPCPPYSCGYGGARGKLVPSLYFLWWHFLRSYWPITPIALIGSGQNFDQDHFRKWPVLIKISVTGQSECRIC